MRFLINFTLLLLLALVVATAPATSQSPPVEPQKKTIVIDKRKLLVQPRNADGTLQVTPFLEDPVLWMRDTQQNFYNRMSGALRQMRSSSGTTAAWTLLVLSFVYGVFHAAGPGHGKAVITGWVLATENELRRGLLIAFMSAIIQSFTAIVIVSVLLLLVQGAAAMARNVAGVLESASYAMIAGMGLYLAWQGLRGGARADAMPVAPQGHVFQLVSLPNPEGELSHVHDENCGCGHAHAPTAADVRGQWNWKRAVALAFAVGVRPCTGAILVLVFSYSMGMYWAGVASTIAMGLGVFITIAAIASLAVFAKGFALKQAGTDNQLVMWGVRTGKLVIGLAIALFGALLFMGSLGSSMAMM